MVEVVGRCAEADPLVQGQAWSVSRLWDAARQVSTVLAVSAGSQNVRRVNLVQRGQSRSATLPRTVYAEASRHLMTRIVEIFLAIDCVVLTAVFYAMWEQQKPEQDSAVLPNEGLAREGGFRPPAKLTSAEWGVEVLEGEALPPLLTMHPADSVERLLIAAEQREACVGRVLLGASEEQPRPKRVGTSMPRHGGREPRSLVGVGV